MSGVIILDFVWSWMFVFNFVLSRRYRLTTCIALSVVIRLKHNLIADQIEKNNNTKKRLLTNIYFTKEIEARLYYNYLNCYVQN